MQGYRYKKFNGENYRYMGWSRYLGDSITYADGLEKRGRKAIIEKGFSSEGDAGYVTYSRKA